jgi:structural maintenance of chromosome 1
MGRLHYVEVKDFKSYKGVHKIGPFKRFTAVIGPNGAGKSNLMDAISFVLGERTQSLRVRSLKELIHGAPIGRPVSSRASVTAVYLSDDGIETRFTRSILGSSSEYRVNEKLVTGSEYSEKLADLGILIKAKNFLVFQGDVETIAMKNPRELTHMFEEISRSVEMKDEYESRKKEMDASHEDANGRFNKKKLLTKEKKEVKEMKEEAEKYQRTQKELADKEILEKLFKMYHAEEDIKRAEGELRERQQELIDLSHRRETCEEQLKLKRQDMARMSRETAVAEKKVRTKEAELSKLRPEFINAKQKSAHVMKRLQASKTAHAKAIKKHEDHEDTIKDLERDYHDVKETAERFEEEFTKKSGQAVELQDVQVQ